MGGSLRVEGEAGTVDRSSRPRGDLFDAVEFGERAIAGGLTGPFNEGARLQPRVQALISVHSGDAAAAADHARAAVTTESPVDSARGRILLGRALALLDDRAAAVAELRRAHADLAGLGAFRYRDEAARELRKLGHAVRHTGVDAGDPPIAGLTNRELEVLELVAAGKTNKDIATHLFLSVRTVDRHLSRIFEKLGVNSRAAAASQFARARGGGH